MCGIFGYVGPKNSLNVCLKGLKQLEYRGYDSAGIAGVYEGKLVLAKDEGKIAKLEEKIRIKDLKLDLAIGHTRWATHGKPDQLNAHPHFDEQETIALVHNGIIENYDSLRGMLRERGITFRSETDTEVIVQLIAYYYKKETVKKNSLSKAVQKTLKLLKGNFAIAIVHKDYPDQIIAASREMPLVIGYDENKSESMISSDPNAFLGQKLNVLFLKNDEIALVKRDNVQVFDKAHKEIVKETEQLEAEYDPPSKDGFEHFMMKEIYEQPLTVQKAILGRYSEEFGTAEFENLNFSPTELLSTNHILILACGTSWHAGCIGAAMLEENARIPTHAEIASELRYKNPIISNKTLVIAISQSGETADTIAALREAKAKGAKILGICNVKNSALTRESDSCIFLKAGPEISVCSTKAFTSQIAVLSLFSLFMGRLRHMSKEDGQSFVNELKKIPQKIKQVIDKAPLIYEIAKKYSKYEDFFFMGRRYMYATCLEAALKLKEISYVNANGYPAGEIKHGPIALINSSFPVVAFCANKQTYDKTLSSMMEVKARGAPILALAPTGADEVANIADDVIWLPPTIDELATFPSSVAGQLFAYYVAKIRGKEIDQPRNLAKSVTVE
jgi:glutamine---fructose-6-phosphate transaminase (isomerizing)